MSGLDRIQLGHLLSMEKTGLLSSDDVFTTIVSPASWSKPTATVVRHGKKRRR